KINVYASSIEKLCSSPSLHSNTTFVASSSISALSKKYLISIPKVPVCIPFRSSFRSVFKVGGKVAPSMISRDQCCPILNKYFKSSDSSSCFSVKYVFKSNLRSEEHTSELQSRE